MGHSFGKLKVNSTRWIQNLKIDLDMTPPLNDRKISIKLISHFLNLTIFSAISARLTPCRHNTLKIGAHKKRPLFWRLSVVEGCVKWSIGRLLLPLVIMFVSARFWKRPFVLQYLFLNWFIKLVRDDINQSCNNEKTRQSDRNSIEPMSDGYATVASATYTWRLITQVTKCR